MFQFANPQIHQFEDKNGFLDSKDPVSILLWNQGNHIMRHLWIQTDHNQDHNCPDYGQPVTIDMYDQTMISLESVWFIITEHYQPVFVWEVNPGGHFPSSSIFWWQWLTTWYIRRVVSICVFQRTWLCRTTSSARFGCQIPTSRSLSGPSSRMWWFQMFSFVCLRMAPSYTGSYHNILTSHYFQNIFGSQLLKSS